MFLSLDGLKKGSIISNTVRPTTLSSDARINIQKPAESLDCLLGVVPQPTDNRLIKTKDLPMSATRRQSAQRQSAPQRQQ